MADEPKVQPEGEPMQLEGASEGATEGQVQQPEQQVDIDGLVETLSRLQIRDSQHLEGLHRTAQAHGPTAQELGVARQQIDNLQRELEALKRTPRDPYADPYDQGQGQPVDLRNEFRSAIREFYQDEVLKPQQEASEAYWRDVENVQGSEFFPVVQDEYEAHMRQPSVQRALSQGRTTHTNEFHKILGKQFQNIAGQLKTAATMIKEQGSKGAKPPHMETGQVPPERPPEGEDARNKQLEDIHKGATGTDDDLEAYLRALIPDGDPILDI